MVSILNFKVEVNSSSQDALGFEEAKYFNIESYNEFLNYIQTNNINKRYAEEFFDKSNLFVYKTWETSGFNQLDVSSLLLDNNDLVVNINRITSDVNTFDMRFWLLIIEYDKPKQDINSITVNITQVKK